MISQAIFWKLSNADGVSRLVEKRIYPNAVKKFDGEYPKLVYEINSDAPDLTSSGGANLNSASVNVMCVTDGNAPDAYKNCGALAQQVAAALHMQRGTWNEVVVQGAFLESIDEETVTDQQSEKILYFIKQLTFSVWYQPLA